MHQQDQYWDNNQYQNNNSGQYQTVNGDQPMFVVMDPNYVDQDGNLGEMIVDDILGIDDLDEGGGAIDPHQATKS